mmetsp:Transcript_79308/g.144820  ORF Transcript_79308/g.144820 Transcript_79308/m.144820 type:complete len:412 (-) Transcript_79308:191-1426(-)
MKPGVMLKDENEGPYKPDNGIMNSGLAASATGAGVVSAIAACNVSSRRPSILASRSVLFACSRSLSSTCVSAGIRPSWSVFCKRPSRLASRRACFACERSCSVSKSPLAAGAATAAGIVARTSSSFPLALALMRMSFACTRSASRSPSPCGAPPFRSASTASSFPSTLAPISVSLAFFRISSSLPSAGACDPFMSARITSSLPSLLESTRMPLAFMRSSSSPCLSAGAALRFERALSNLPSLLASIRFFLANSRIPAIASAGGGAAALAAPSTGASACFSATGAGGGPTRVSWFSFFRSISEMNPAGSFGFSLSTACMASERRISRLCSSRYCLASCTFGLTFFAAALSPSPSVLPTLTRKGIAAVSGPHEILISCSPSVSGLMPMLALPIRLNTSTLPKRLSPMAFLVNL